MQVPLHRLVCGAIVIIVAGIAGACSTTDGEDLLAASTAAPAPNAAAAPAVAEGAVAAPAPAPATTSGGAEKKQLTAADFTKTKFCPPLEIRPTTEAMTIYERGKDKEPGNVRYQASITKTARECQHVGDTLMIKVGVSGRVVAGPKGGAGSVTLPIRIAVVRQMGGQKPLYSDLFKKSVPVSAPTFGSSYSEVYDQVSLKVTPQDRDLIVFVGFDEGA